MLLSPRKIALSVFLLLAFTGLSQRKSNWTVDIGKTQTYPGFFYLYDGSVDLSVGYHLNIADNLFVGGAFGLQFLGLNGTQSKTVIYKPKLILEYHIRSGKSFNIVPLIAVGYSFLKIKNNEYGYSSLQQGFNISPELKLLWKTGLQTDFYLFGRYDYVKLIKDEDFTFLNYYRNANITSFGIGVVIKRKKHAQPEKY